MPGDVARSGLLVQVGAGGVDHFDTEAAEVHGEQS